MRVGHIIIYYFNSDSQMPRRAKSNSLFGFSTINVLIR